MILIAQVPGHCLPLTFQGAGGDILAHVSNRLTWFCSASSFC